MQGLIFLIIAAGAGVLMAIQGSLNSALSKVIGVLEGNFILHAVGLLIVVIMLFVSRWCHQCCYHLWSDAFYRQNWCRCGYYCYYHGAVGYVTGHRSVWSVWFR